VHAQSPDFGRNHGSGVLVSRAYIQNRAAVRMSVR
jgi:hypothetical protein